MILEEFDAKKYEKAIREDEHEIAYAAGREEGREEGIKSFIEAATATGFGVDYTIECLQKYFLLERHKAEELYERYVNK